MVATLVSAFTILADDAVLYVIFVNRILDFFDDLVSSIV
jgi:hypothetical protein